MTNSNTSINSNTSTTEQEIELRQRYNEYLFECKANGLKAKTLSQYRSLMNWGNVIDMWKVEGKKVDGVVSKADISRNIFEEEVKSGELIRKKVIARFKAEAGLTDAGAATYYANFKKKMKEAV